MGPVNQTRSSISADELPFAVLPARASISGDANISSQRGGYALLAAIPAVKSATIVIFVVI